MLINCPDCKAASKRNGKDRSGEQKFKCSSCGSVFTTKPKLDGKRVPAAKIEMVINLLVEGTSVRSCERLTGIHRDTILRLLETVGERCLMLQETLVRNVKVSDIEADEVWSYVKCKQKTANSLGLGHDETIGSVYTFTAVEKTSKLLVAFHLGQRTESDALIFLEKLAAATETTKRLQISTDAFRGYDHTVNEVLGTKADYAQVVKLYRASRQDESRYSPSEVIGIRKKIVCGNPDLRRTSTSIVERSNLTIRMATRRLTRLTNAFSKKFENHNYALALFFCYYNFCRIHKTLRCTPAMEAGLTNHIWELSELIGIQ